ncbi:MAG: hypothetical protein Q4G04_01760, partial [bacterium]|nr:hypothetical protein [bacterium]
VLTSNKDLLENMGKSLDDLITMQESNVNIDLTNENFILPKNGKIIVTKTTLTLQCTGELYLPANTVISSFNNFLLINDNQLDICTNDNSQYYFSNLTISPVVSQEEKIKIITIYQRS